METGNHLEPGEGWGGEGGGEEWARIQSLLELVRRENQEAELLSPERREQIRERLLERLASEDARRRRRRTLVATASTVLLAAVALTVAVRARMG